MDNTDGLADAYRDSESRESSRTLKFLAPRIKVLNEAMRLAGFVEDCPACVGRGFIPPATLIECRACSGAGIRLTASSERRKGE